MRVILRQIQSETEVEDLCRPAAVVVWRRWLTSLHQLTFGRRPISSIWRRWTLHFRP